MGTNLEDYADVTADSFKFEKVGDIARGVVVFHSIYNGDSYDEQRTEKTLKIVLEDAEGETYGIYPVLDQDVGGETARAGKSNSMAKAIAAACKKTGDGSLYNGGKLAVKLDELKDTGKGNPAKLYVAQWEPPAVIVEDDVVDDDGDMAVDDLLG